MLFWTRESEHQSFRVRSLHSRQLFSLQTHRIDKPKPPLDSPWNSEQKYVFPRWTIQYALHIGAKTNLLTKWAFRSKSFFSRTTRVIRQLRKPSCVTFSSLPENHHAIWIPKDWYREKDHKPLEHLRKRPCGAWDARVGGCESDHLCCSIILRR